MPKRIAPSFVGRLLRLAKVFASFFKKKRLLSWFRPAG
jgi:hypothetical protein